MGWLTKILNGSSYKGQYHGKYADDRTWDEPSYSVDQDDSSDFDREEIDRAIAISLSEADQKGKKVVENKSDSEEELVCIKSDSDEDEQEEYELSAKAQLEEDRRRAKAQVEEDEQLAKAIEESLSMEPPPPQYDTANIFQPFSFFYPSGYRICAGCKTEIGNGRYLSCMDAVWHPECFRCHACNQPIRDIEV